MDPSHVTMGGAAAPSPFAFRPRRRGMMMHMTFFWGDRTEVLFDGWPGERGIATYLASLAFVFVLAVLVEWLSACRLIKPGTLPVVAGLVRTLMHTVRVGLAYLVMLAIMSFNGGVFLAVVAGHGVGFLVFGSRVFEKSGGEGRVVNGYKSGGHGQEGDSDLPAMSC